MMKTLFAMVFLLINTPTHAVDMCDTSGGSEEFEAFDEIQDNLDLPKVNVSYSLDEDCKYTVKTTAQIGSNKSLPDFMNELTGKNANLKSANKLVEGYVLSQVGNVFVQTLKASKSGVSATIVNTCMYTTNTKDSSVFKCYLKDGDGALESNETTISCTNSNGSVKTCNFLTVGKAKAYKKLGITLKGPCDLSAGGAAETVNGITRLSQYISNGEVDENKWTVPGAAFYKSAKELVSKRPGSFQQKIQ